MKEIIDQTWDKFLNDPTKNVADIALDITVQAAIERNDEPEINRLVSIMNHSDRYFMSEILVTCSQVFQNSEDWNNSNLKHYLQKWS